MAQFIYPENDGWSYHVESQQASVQAGDVCRDHDDLQKEFFSFYSGDLSPIPIQWQQRLSLILTLHQRLQHLHVNIATMAFTLMLLPERRIDCDGGVKNEYAGSH